MVKRFKETTEEVVENKELSPREKRLLKSQSAKPEKKEVDHKEEFRKFFIQLKTKHNLAPELEQAIWLHLRAIGCAEVSKFSEGVTDFGYKF